MVFPRKALILIYLAIFALIVGCSGGGGEAPTSPDMTGPDSPEMSRTNSNYIWGLGEVVLNIEEGTAEVIPARSAEFTLNLTRFYNPPADVSNFQVTLNPADCDIANRIIDLNLILSHPFPGTGYWGFDTRMTIFGGATTVGKHDTTVAYPSAEELRILNADGYMRWWNKNEFGPLDKIFGYCEGWIATPGFSTSFGTVNGFKYFYDGCPPTEWPIDPSFSNRGVFTAGPVSRKTAIQFPDVSQPYRFKYSIGASWELSDPFPPTTPSDFPLNANTAEAYNIIVTQDEVASTAFYDPDDHTFGGDLMLDIEVFDWQGDGDPEGEIAGVWVESQTLFPTPVNLVGNADWTATMTSDQAMMYSGILENVTPTSIVGQELFITVENTDPNTYAPPLPDFLYPDSPLAAFQVFICNILDNGIPPEKTIIVTDPDGGETANIDQVYEITWDWTGPIINVDIDLSLDDGVDGFAIPLAASEPCDGDFDWTPLAGQETEEALIRITESGISPEAQDQSDAVFTIEEETNPDAGWNPVDGATGVVLDPMPNQSSYTPDLGIQNDGAGAEGAWTMDNEGGMPTGPVHQDFTLDWSGPGGNAFQVWNFLIAPFNRFDVGGLAGCVISGLSANTDSFDPPWINDPPTGMWWQAYITADGTHVPGDGVLNIIGDTGSDPDEDPDDRPWGHWMDLSSGQYGGESGWSLDNDLIACGKWSTLPGAPIPEDCGVPGQYDNGGLTVAIRQYPFDDPSSGLYSWNFPDWTTDNTPAPVDQAFDVTDPDKCRLAADTSSYLISGWIDPPEDLACPMYMLDSGGNFYATFFELELSAGMVHFIAWSSVIRIRPDWDDLDLYLDDAIMVDLEMIPTIQWLYEGLWELGPNWLAVIYETDGGETVLRIYNTDWSAETLEEVITILETEDPIPGTPLAVDVDPANFEIHVLTLNGGNVEATVYDYTPE